MLKSEIGPVCKKNAGLDHIFFPKKTTQKRQYLLVCVGLQELA